VATIGQPLTAPENGWRRYDDNDLFLKYSGIWTKVSFSGFWGSAQASTTELGAKVEFYFTGTKLRLLGQSFSNGDGSVKISIDGNIETFSQQGTDIYQVLFFEKTGLTNKTHKVIIEKTSDSTKYIRLDAIDIESTGVLKDPNKPYDNKILISSGGTYKYFNGANWINLSDIVTESDYLTYGMDGSVIPQISIRELEGVIKVHHYTDNTDQTESSITLETEPLTLEDYLEGSQSLDVLTYTDSDEVPTVKTEVGYSPIDELSDTFDIVTFVETSSESENINVTANVIPKNQFVTKASNILYYGDIQSFVTSITSSSPDLSKIRFLLSFDNGSTWKSFVHDKWKDVNISNKFDILLHGMRSNDINSIPKEQFNNVLTNGMRIGYYIEERAWTDDSESVNVTKLNTNASINDIKISNLLYFVVNTLAVIDANVAGNKVLGSITDEDLGKVQYRVKLNGEFIYPLDGAYTLLADTPLDLDVQIDNKKIILGANNTIQVDFKDGWGNLDSWSTSFFGKPVGLIFSTPAGQYYSNAFGEILRYLNFGTMIAGQTTVDEKVVLSNTLPFKVKDVVLTTEINAQGVEIQLSKTANPFIAQEGLIYNEELKTDDSVDFYVRLKLNDNAVGNHLFDINASADPA